MPRGYHQITGSESIGTIAEMYGSNPQAILNENPGVSRLSAGAFLRLPTGGGGGDGVPPVGVPPTGAGVATGGGRGGGNSIPTSTTTPTDPTNYHEAGFSNPAPTTTTSTTESNRNPSYRRTDPGHVSYVYSSPFRNNGLPVTKLTSDQADLLGYDETQMASLGFIKRNGEDYTFVGVENAASWAASTTATTTRVAAGVDPTAIFGRYEAKSGQEKGTALTAQEAFQQGTYKPSTRWWIRGLEDKWKPKTTTNDASTGDGTNVAGAIGSNASIWRIGT